MLPIKEHVSLGLLSNQCPSNKCTDEDVDQVSGLFPLLLRGQMQSFTVHLYVYATIKASYFSTKAELSDLFLDYAN